MPPITLDDLSRALDAYVDPHRIPDAAPTGLQVRGAGEGATVARVALGVSANRELFAAAAEWGAEAVLVHHGLFWAGDDPAEEHPGRRFDEARAAFLRERGMSLFAYHLPLDAHPEVGNNAEIARRLGLTVVAADFGDLAATEVKVGLIAGADPPLRLEELVGRVNRVFGQPAHVAAAGPEAISSIAIVSGGAPDEIYAAIARGVDAYLTGEGREWVPAIAREARITFLAVGHHASEVFGVQALGRWLEARFGLETRFFAQANPF